MKISYRADFPKISRTLVIDADFMVMHLFGSWIATMNSY